MDNWIQSILNMTWTLKSTSSSCNSQTQCRKSATHWILYIILAKTSVFIYTKLSKDVVTKTKRECPYYPYKKSMNLHFLRLIRHKAIKQNYLKISVSSSKHNSVYSTITRNAFKYRKASEEKPIHKSLPDQEHPQRSESSFPKKKASISTTISGYRAVVQLY